jgi:putative zinc finger protein
MIEHPAAEVMAAYLNDALPAPDRVTLEAHLAECRPCRQEVTSARRLLERRSLRSTWSFTVPAAAAAILALALLGRGFLAPPVEEEVVRGSGQARDAEVVPSIRVLSPTDENIIAGHPILFAWLGQTGGRPLYRLTVTDGSGQPLWVRDTTDTTLTLPASVSLAPGRTYFWYVDALDSAGRSLTTGTRRFSIAP